jgi:hypothetical protein
MHVCICDVCVYVCMYVCICDICVYICMYVMYVCMHVCTECMYTYVQNWGGENIVEGKA